MPKAFNAIISVCFIFCTLTQSTKLTKEEELIQLAKRSLFQREKEFIKMKPMSEDLKEFIERFKRKDGRQKREDIDENLLYVIQNGQLVPFKSMKGFKRSDEEKKPETYTVVPLIIPVDMRAPAAKLIKTRTLTEELQGAKDDKSAPTPPTFSSIDVSSTTLNPEEMDDGSNSNNNNTKEENEVLHRILQDVEGLMQWRQEGSKKEGVICNINGSWISDAAGMRFDISYKNSTRKKFRIHLADRIPPNEDGFLCDGNWTVFGELPFQHSGMVIALAVHEKDKHIATFIGECRVCEGSETVTGTWLLGRSSRDCKDQKASHKILSDVWKREQGHTLRKKHLQMIGYNVKDDED